ncbi:MAG: hypothetical protein JWM68_3158 [Verrucomicrobiales bacterium]|nr:hypothetical protein [Verrucomicrobiales bacterium]
MGIKKSILIALVFVAVIAMVAFLMKPASATPLTLPNPNGYDEIIKAVQLTPAQTSKVGDEFQRAGEPVLKLAHEALQKECMISDPHALASTNSAHTDNLLGIHYLAQSFVVRGTAAHAEHRNHDATMDCLDAIRLGAKGLRGGVMFDRMMGTGCEKIGAQALKRMLPTLSAPECSEVLAALEEIEQERESIETTLANEREFIVHSATLLQQLGALLMFKSQQQVVKKFRITTEAVISSERQLMLDCAGRMFELEKSRKPTSAQELVPTYLKMIPQDATTQTNLTL